MTVNKGKKKKRRRRRKGQRSSKGVTVTDLEKKMRNGRTFENRNREREIKKVMVIWIEGREEV